MWWKKFSFSRYFELEAGPQVARRTPNGVHVIKRETLADALDLQGDPSPCAKPPVDFISKVPFWPGLPCHVNNTYGTT